MDGWTDGWMQGVTKKKKKELSMNFKNEMIKS